MITPTKEQIEKVAYAAFKKCTCKDWPPEYTCLKWYSEMQKQAWMDAAEIYITEWEKIRNSPK